MLTKSTTGIVFIIVQFSLLRINSAQHLQGSDVRCENEGEFVNLTLTAGNPCINCYCKNRKVVCERDMCPSVEGCYFLKPEPLTSECCPKTCLGCTYGNQTMQSGESFRDSNNPCINIHCQAGLITKSEDQCFVPCKNPVTLPSHCCPVCTECKYRGKSYTNGEAFIERKDKCVTCTCQNGSIECRKRACPVLNCPISSIVEPENGECCPKCIGSRKIFLPETRCLYHPQGLIYENTQTIIKDTCQTCSCQQGTIFCTKKTCPRLKCRSKDIIDAPIGHCCPTCPPPKQKCMYGGRKYKHGRLWYRDKCTTCTCNDGATHCTVRDCSGIVSSCPKTTHELRYISGLCCPQCVEISATCVVFGDPHYRTFDGLLYTYQGTCQYTLAQQCSSNQRAFSIRVQNSAWPDKAQYAYTNSVTIRTKQLKVVLHQLLRVTVNNKDQKLPFIKLGHMSIVQRGYTLVVTTSHGVTLIWDGLSYLELTIPQKYKNKMCGLCGNYNGDAKDDFTGRGSVLYRNAVEFGNSWERGKRCMDTSLNTDLAGRCMTDRETMGWISDRCELFRQDEVLEHCNSLVNLEVYYQQCVDKLCTCDDPIRCYCLITSAFLKACDVRHLFKDELKTC